MPSEGIIDKRILYYERIVTNGKTRYFFLPFAQVTINSFNAATGRLWEPRNMVRNSMLQTFEKEEIHSIEEWDHKAKLLNSANEPDGIPIQLHSFSACDWISTS